MREHARLTSRWLAFSILFIAGLGGVTLLKFNGLLSDSITERLSIVSTTSAQDFSSALDLGLAVDEIANGRAILDQGRRHDPNIRSITVFSPTGAVIHQATDHPTASIDAANLDAFQIADARGDNGWGLETSTRLSSGNVISGSFGVNLAGIAVNYSKEEMQSQSAIMRSRLAATGLFVAALIGMGIPAGIGTIERRSKRSARTKRRFVSAWIVTLLTVGVVVYGLFIWADFNELLEPEVERRADLIGLTIAQDVSRAVELGIPLSDLVGMEEYFAVFMAEFPEVDHLAIRNADGAVIHSVGRNGPALTALGATDHGLQRETVNAVVYGYETHFESSVDVGIDRLFVTSRLQDLALDVVVILLVALVVAFELMGSVSRNLPGAARSGSDSVLQADGLTQVRLVLFLFVVAEELNKSFLPLFIEAAESPIPDLDPAVAISLPIVSYLLALGVVSPMASGLIHRVGQRKLFLIGLIPAGLSHLGMIFTDNVLEIIALRALTGVGYAVATIAAQEHILSRLRSGARARTIGVFVVVVIGGTLSGTALGGIFADRLGYDAVFTISLGLVIVAGLFAFRLIAVSVEDHEAIIPTFDRSDFLEAMRSPQVMMLLAGVTIPMNVLMAAFLWYLVPLSLADFGLNASAIARTLMLYYLVILISGPLASHLADRRLSRWGIVGVGSAVAGVALVMPAYAPSAATVAVAVVVVGIGHAAVRAPQVALALDIADSHESSGRRGAILAAMRSLERIGSLIGLLGVSLMAAAFDLHFATGAIGILVAIAGIIFLTSAGRFAPVQESAHA